MHRASGFEEVSSLRESNVIAACVSHQQKHRPTILKDNLHHGSPGRGGSSMDELIFVVGKSSTKGLFAHCDKTHVAALTAYVFSARFRALKERLRA